MSADRMAAAARKAWRRIRQRQAPARMAARPRKIAVPSRWRARSVDQVPRRMAYEAAHPNVEILYLGPYWQAIIREDNGQTIITRHELRGLLDKLEALDAEDSNEQPGQPG